MEAFQQALVKPQRGLRKSSTQSDDGRGWGPNFPSRVHVLRKLFQRSSHSLEESTECGEILANAADLSCLKVILDLSDPLVRFTLRSHQTCQIVSSKIQIEGITVLHCSDLIKFTHHQFRDGVQAMHLRLWRFKRWFHRVDECPVRRLSKALPLTTSMHP